MSERKWTMNEIDAAYAACDAERRERPFYFELTDKLRAMPVLESKDDGLCVECEALKDKIAAALDELDRAHRIQLGKCD